MGLIPQLVVIDQEEGVTGRLLWVWVALHVAVIIQRADELLYRVVLNHNFYYCNHQKSKRARESIVGWDSPINWLQ